MQFYEQALKSYNKYSADPKRKSYLEIILTLILLIVLLLMIYPAVTHIITLNKEIVAGKQIDTALSGKIRDLDSAKNNLEKVKDDLPLLELALPTSSAVDAFLQKPLEDLANKHGLAIKSVQFNDVPVSKSESENPTLRDMVFTLGLSGDFAKTAAFLKDLEDFVRVTNIETIQVKGSGNNLSVTIQAITSYLGDPITVPNQAGAAQ